jgi:hypothetical protein
VRRHADVVARAPLLSSANSVTDEVATMRCWTQIDRHARPGEAVLQPVMPSH